MTPIDDRSPVIEQSFPGTPEVLNRARMVVGDALDRGGVPHEDAQRIVLAFSEMASNAVEAAPGEDFHVRMLSGAAGVDLEVGSNSSLDDMPDRDEWGPDEAFSVRGRGLSIVEMLATNVRVDRQPPPLLWVKASFNL